MAAILADDMFDCIFVNKKMIIPIHISLKYAPSSPNWQKAIIDSGNGLAPNRRQAIIWINDDPAHWRIYAA